LLRKDGIGRGCLPSAASRIRNNVNAEAASLAARLQRLTRRERQVMEQVVAGRHNREITADLGIRPRTVEVY